MSKLFMFNRLQLPFHYLQFLFVVLFLGICFINLLFEFILQPLLTFIGLSLYDLQFIFYQLFLIL